MEATLNDILGGPEARGNTLRRSLRDCLRKPLALDVTDGSAVLLERLARGELVANSDLLASLGRAELVRPPTAAGVAVIPIRGALLYDLEMPPYCTSTRALPAPSRRRRMTRRSRPS